MGERLVDDSIHAVQLSNTGGLLSGKRPADFTSAVLYFDECMQSVRALFSSPLVIRRTFCISLIECDDSKVDAACTARVEEMEKEVAAASESGAVCEGKLVLAQGAVKACEAQKVYKCA